jgi:hypothetical protein
MNRTITARREVFDSTQVEKGTENFFRALQRFSSC